jgi:hypothetical protein
MYVPARLAAFVAAIAEVPQPIAAINPQITLPAPLPVAPSPVRTIARRLDGACASGAAGDPGLDANPHWPAPGGVPSSRGAGADGEEEGEQLRARTGRGGDPARAASAWGASWGGTRTGPPGRHLRGRLRSGMGISLRVEEREPARAEAPLVRQPQPKIALNG